MEVSKERLSKELACKELVERIRCHLTPEACIKGKIILLENCMELRLKDTHAHTHAHDNTVSKMAICSMEKDGGGKT
jgi:hypothetical protein